jgi:DNA-binding NarL/FixJ family response regulator
MTATDPIRVMIVDDHGMVRKGLATILRIRDDLELVGEASDVLTSSSWISLCPAWAGPKPRA